MTTILDKIIEEKRKEIAFLKNSGSSFQRVARPKRSFIEKLKQAEKIAIISEFKRSSPSKGIINHAADPAEQAAVYEKNGAAAISVLTDEVFFKGSFSDLQAVRAAVNLPILCKDFIIDSIQIDKAIYSGADIILLIVAALEEKQLEYLYRYAKNRNLEVLLEVHNEEELAIAIKMGVQLIGVNNRNLKTFEVSLSVTEQLASIVKSSGAYLISESGIHKTEDVERVRAAGANGILVGEALMKSNNLIQTFKEFSIPLSSQGVSK